MRMKERNASDCNERLGRMDNLLQNFKSHHFTDIINYPPSSARHQVPARPNLTFILHTEETNNGPLLLNKQLINAPGIVFTELDVQSIFVMQVNIKFDWNGDFLTFNFTKKRVLLNIYDWIGQSDKFFYTLI